MFRYSASYDFNILTRVTKTARAIDVKGFMVDKDTAIVDDEFNPSSNLAVLDDFAIPTTPGVSEKHGERQKWRY